MKIPLSKLGMVDIDLKTVPKKAWIILAWSVFVLSIGLAMSLARWGKVVVIVPHGGGYHKVKGAEALYVEGSK